jgi:hypothetical protein
MKKIDWTEYPEKVLICFLSSSDDEDRDGHKLTIKISFKTDVHEYPKIAPCTDRLIEITRVEKFEVVPDETDEEYKKYFDINHDTDTFPNEMNLYVLVDNEDDLLYMSLPKAVE